MWRELNAKIHAGAPAVDKTTFLANKKRSFLQMPFIDENVKIDL
jgi:hypothetical protein